jgi:Bacterial Ig-like domain/Right handed beta helix region
MDRINLRSCLAALILVLLFSGCSNPLQTAIEEMAENIPPTCVSDPAEGSTLHNLAAVTISFSEKITPASLSLDGSMAGECDGGTWNAPQYDELVLRPDSIWSDGDHLLMIDCSDTAGNAMPTATFAFTVDSSIPVVVSLSPDLEAVPFINGSSGGSLIDVSFSKAMNPSSITASLVVSGSTTLSEGSDYTLSWPDSTTLRIDPAGDWPEGSTELSISGEDAVGNPLVPYSTDYLVDLTAPTLTTVTPVPDSVLTTNQSITFDFSESMDTGSLSISGGLIAAGSGTSWDANTDRLTISPSSSWNIGALQSFVLNAADAAGNSVSLSGDFDVAVVFVSPSGNDSWSGSRVAPKKTIAAAVNYADSQFDTGRVHATQGIYQVSFAAGTHVILREGISIYGGYNSSLTVRNPAAYVTEIREVSTTGGGTSIFDYTNMNRIIDASGSITRATVMDGFTLRGGGGDAGGCASAIYTYSGASPTISNCIIHPATIGLHSAAMLEGYAGVFTGNTIPETSSTGWAWTISVTGPNGGGCEITNNIIHGIDYSGNMGVRLLSILEGTALIENNQFLGAAYSASQLSDDTAIYLDTCGSSTIVDGNSITGPTGTARVVGIQVYSGNPVIRNNLVYLPHALYSTGPYLKGIGITLDYSGTPARPAILNNTFILGDAVGSVNYSSVAWGIYAYENDPYVIEPRIENNIFYAKTGVSDEREAIIMNCDTVPSSLKNNCFYNFERLYMDATDDYHYVDNWITKYGLSYLENDKAFASGNQYLNPGFVDLNGLDFHLRSNAEVNVRQGGLTLADVTRDLEDNTRTAPFSMGAYERD